MGIEYTFTEPRLFASYDPCNVPAAKVVGTGLVLALSEVLKEYEVELVSVVEGGLRAVVQGRGSAAVCPSCHQASSRVWSRYWRTAGGRHLSWPAPAAACLRAPFSLREP